MQDCRQWVKSRIEDRGAKPCEFSQTALIQFKTLLFLANNMVLPVILKTASLLELLDLPKVLDNASGSRDTPASLPGKDDYSEDIPIEDEDEIENDAEPNNENRSS